MSIHLVTGYAGKAHIKAANHGAYNAAVVGPGQYVLDFGTMFEASVLSANKIRIYDGILLNQGRQIQIDPNTYEEVDIENGSQGYMRNDIIAMRYSKNAETDIESASLVVIKGTSAETNPIDPECVSGDIINGAVVSDMPLYRVPLDGLTVGELVPLFEIKPSMENMIISDLDEMTAITIDGKYVADAKAVGELKRDVNDVSNNLSKKADKTLASPSQNGLMSSADKSKLNILSMSNITQFQIRTVESSTINLPTSGYCYVIYIGKANYEECAQLAIGYYGECAGKVYVRTFANSQATANWVQL